MSVPLVANTCSLPWMGLVSLALAVVYVGNAPARESHAVEPPVAGQPANFSGGIGTFHVTSRAVPTQLQAEDAIHLTVRVTGTGSLQHIARPELRRLAKFTALFHVENLKDRYVAQQNAREFDYLLRPKHAEVKEIPAIPFVYFKPGVVPDYKGYQTTYAPAIPITVKERAAVLPSQIEGPASRVSAADSAYDFAKGPGVLQRERAFLLPGTPILILLLLASLLPGAVWYGIWLYRYPDAARAARQRRSRAARQALRALDRATHQPEQAAERSATILLTYLRNRLEFDVTEPTPAEVARCLENAGSRPALVQETVRFLKACDAARFAPGLEDPQRSKAPEAAQLILAMEAEQWPLQAF
jgi:hypothetical protein